MTTTLEKSIESFTTNILFEKFVEVVGKVSNEKGLVVKLKRKSLEKSKPLPVAGGCIGDSEDESYESEFDIFSGNVKVYTIKQKKESEHVWGRGGYSLSSSSLFKVNGKTTELLRSYSSVRWETYSDESEDHTTENTKYTDLYVEEPLARKIFEELKKLK